MPTALPRPFIAFLRDSCHKSIRDIPIPSDVVPALRRHKAEQEVVTPDGFVCTNSREEDVKAARMLLGHADVKTTLAIYQSVTEEMKQDVARAMEGITRATSSE